MYLKSTDNRPDDNCDPENDNGTHQTKDHLSKHCFKWKVQQAAMWARVKEAAKKGKQKWRVGDLLADERCSPAVLDFLRSTHGEHGPPVEENWDSEDGMEAEADEAEADEVGVVTRGLLVSGFICNFLDAGSASFSFVISLVRFLGRRRDAAIEPNLQGGTAHRIRVK